MATKVITAHDGRFVELETYDAPPGGLTNRGRDDMKRSLMVLALCGLWGVMTAIGTAQQPAAPPARVAEAEVEQWIRATSGASSAASDPNSDTRFLASLSNDERQGGFLFRQRCYACHYSALSPLSYGPRLSQTNVIGREQAARATIADGTSRMPAFRHGLTAAQIDLIIAYLKKVKNP